MPTPNHTPVVVPTRASSAAARALSSGAPPAALPFRAADAGLTAAPRFPKLVAPVAKPGPGAE